MLKSLSEAFKCTLKVPHDVTRSCKGGGVVIHDRRSSWTFVVQP